MHATTVKLFAPFHQSSTLDLILGALDESMFSVCPAESEEGGSPENVALFNFR